jgi:hypothetical protein
MRPRIGRRQAASDPRTNPAHADQRARHEQRHPSCRWIVRARRPGCDSRSEINRPAKTDQTMGPVPPFRLRNTIGPEPGTPCRRSCSRGGDGALHVRPPREGFGPSAEDPFRCASRPSPTSRLSPTSRSDPSLAGRPSCPWWIRSSPSVVRTPVVKRLPAAPHILNNASFCEASS